MPKLLAPLPNLQLDPRNTEALVNAIQTEIYLKSNGTLTDFSAASPLAAITEGQAYAQSELLYYLNSLPEAFVLQWLKLLGIQRIVGSHSTAELLFFRQPGYNRSIIIPKDTEFYTSSGLMYNLIETIEISTDDPVSGIVQSSKWGEIYNTPANTITRTSKTIPGLNRFSNPRPASGGESVESVGEMKSRALAVLSRRALITKEDYISEASILFPKLDTIGVFTHEDLQTYVDGLSPSHVYVCYAPMSEQTTKELLTAFTIKAPLGTDISIIDPTYTRLKIDVTAEYSTQNVGSLDSVANRIYQNILSVFQNKPLGTPLFFSELLDILSSSPVSFVIGKIGGVQLFLDEPEPDYSGCSQYYHTITDVDGICTPDYSWVLENSGEYVPSPIEVYTVFEVNVSLVNSNTANTTTYTFINA